MNATTYGVDIAKNVMQVHWVDADSGEIGRKKLTRAKFFEFFAQRLPARVALEACGGAHEIARQLGALGHQPELLPTGEVRAFVRGNKDDAADARGVWLAAQQSDIRRVPIKSRDQQAVLSLHRMRQHWVDTRTATINALRGLLYEFGIILPRGKQAGRKALAERRAEIDARLPAPMVRLMDAQLRALEDVQRHAEAMEDELGAVQKADANAKRLRKVPGLGVLGATALSAALGDALGWSNGRVFSTSIGLAPRHSGSGGKVHMGSMSKRGDTYLRWLLINGARSILMQANPPEWVAKLLERRPFNVVVVALAHRIARTAWALVRHQREFDVHWKSQPPGTVSAQAA